MFELIQFFSDRFDVVDERSSALLSRVPEERLFWTPLAVEESGEPYSCGELIIRAGAAIEQTFGGITTRLWDDPFEWSLPEELSDKSRVLDYLEQVTATRRKGFQFFSADSDLFKSIPAPERLKPIVQILLETLDRASHLQGRSYGVAQQFIRLRPHLP